MTGERESIPPKAGCSDPAVGAEISRRLGCIDRNITRHRHRQHCLACQVEALLFWRASREAPASSGEVPARGIRDWRDP